MLPLPVESLALLGAVFLLGAQHGLDPDHLAAWTQVFDVPDWLKHTGAWISIAVLFLLGILNLAAARARSGFRRAA